jgi:hypothetical protein
MVVGLDLKGAALSVEHAQHIIQLATDLGRPVQVDPIRPRLKPPGTKRLKLNCDVLRSNSAYKFSLRRYTSGSKSGC